MVHKLDLHAVDQTARHGYVLESDEGQRLTASVLQTLRTPLTYGANVRLLKSGRELSRSEWVSSRAEYGYVVHSELECQRIEQHLASGGMLVAESVDEQSFELLDLRESLEYPLNARAWVNVYIASGWDSEFGAHFDSMDTIIVQILGKRRWTVDRVASGAAGKFRNDFTVLDLNVGDAIFVPSGVNHNVEALGELSIHLTIGFDRYCGLGAQVRAMSELLGISEPIPVPIDLSIAKARLPDRRRGSSLPFAVTGSAEHCGVVRWASRLPPATDVHEGILTVTTLGLQIEVPSQLRPALDLLLDGGWHFVSELQSATRVSQNQLVHWLQGSVAQGLVQVKPVVR